MNKAVYRGHNPGHSHFLLLWQTQLLISEDRYNESQIKIIIGFTLHYSLKRHLLNSQYELGIVLGA